MRINLNDKVFHRWLIPALIEWAAIALLFTAGFALDHWLVWALVVVIVGSRQHALGVQGHDGAHFTAARSRTVNDLVTQLLCFWPLGCGLGGFRRFHFAHHRHFGTDKDPELLFKNDWSKEQWTLPTTRAQIIRYFLLDLVGFGVPETIKAFRLLGRVGIWDWVGPTLLWATVGVVLHVTGLWFAAVIWVVALGTSFWGFFRLRTWTEHVGTPTTHRVRANWWQRMFITPHGSWSHYEHHEHPSVPFWKRAELRGANDRTVTMGELFGSFGNIVPGRRRQNERADLLPGYESVGGSTCIRLGRGLARFAFPIEAVSDGLSARSKTTSVRLTARAIRSQIADEHRHLSAWKGPALFLANALLYVLGLGAVIACPWWFTKLLGVALVARAMGGLLNLGHDAGHNSLTPYIWLNRLLGRLALLPALHPFSVWRVSHDRAHHDFTNLKGKDYIWAPLSKEEYDGLSFFGRLRQRLYRTLLGVGAYYLIEIWLQMAFRRGKGSMRKGPRRLTVFLDRLLVGGYVALLGWGLCALHHNLAVAWGLPELSAPAVLALGIVLPFVVFCWLFGAVTLQQHTHPRIKWYADRHQWTFYRGAVASGTHLTMPWPWSLLVPDLSGHTAHHVDPRVPHFRLGDSQRQVDAAFPEMVVQEFTLTNLRRVLATCRLYDYKSHRWLDFTGKPTTAPLTEKPRHDSLQRTRTQPVAVLSKTPPKGREVRAHIPEDARERSTFMGLAIFLANFLLYGLTLAGILACPWWSVKLLCATLNGLFVAHLLSIGHDAGHNTLTGYTWLNNLLGRLAVLPSLYPFSVWRVTHDRAHHDFTNLKGKDFIWVPLSMEEYGRLSFCGRLLQRLYRTVLGVGLYYLIELWLKNAFGKNKQMTGKGLNSVVAGLDRLLVLGFPVLLSLVLCAALPQLMTPVVLALALLVPFLVHCWLTGLLTFLHHTHPEIKWYADRREWTFFGGAVQGTTHVIGPWPWGILLPNLTEHNAHHVDPKVPLYNLPKTQKLLEEVYPEVIVQEFTFAAFRRLLATCQLYDYENHRWHDFAGEPTSAALTKSRSASPDDAECPRRIPA